MGEDVPFSTISTAAACTAKFCHAVRDLPWNTQEITLRLSSADVRLMTFLPYDLARLSGEPGLFLGANVFGQILSHVRFGS